MFEHTVVAAHFSSASGPIFESLRELHERGTRELTLVDVLRSHHSDSQDEAHRREAKLRLEEEKVALEAAGFTVHIELRTGQPAHELSTIARARGASLILVGARGQNHFREFLRGSTVLQLIRKTSTATLLEPVEASAQKIRGRGFRSLLLATDFSESCREAERTAIELADKADRIVLAHVLEDDTLEDLGSQPAEQQAREKLEALAERLGDARSKATIRIEEGATASRELRRIAEDEDATMLIVGKRGRSPIRELMLGSTAQNVVRQADQSVLMVPRTGRM